MIETGHGFTDHSQTSPRPADDTRPHAQPGADMNMNIKQLTALAALLLLARGQAMAEDVRVDCMTDQRIVCRNDETTCRPPVKESAWYHFKFDLTKKTGSLVFCGAGVDCMEASPLTIVHDYCAFLRDHGAGCLVSSGSISVWEPIQQQTYSLSNSRYVMTASVIATDHSLSVTEFGRCAVQ
jgi:hypothetical protein